MPDYAGPPEDQALELGPRQPLYAAFYLALLVAWVPTKVAAVTAALVGAIDVGAFSIVQRRADASASESESDSHASGHHSDVHHRYPPIHSLEAGNGRLFLPASDPRRQADRLCRGASVATNKRC